MLKSKCLSLVLNVDFMTLTSLKLEFSFRFLEFIIYLEGIITKQNRRMSTCNWLDLQTVGSQPIYAQKSPQSLLHYDRGEPAISYK